MMNISGGIKGLAQWIGAKIQIRTRDLRNHLDNFTIYVYDADVSNYVDWSHYQNTY